MGPRCMKPDTKIFIFKKWWIDRTINLYDQHGGKILIVGRFLPLIRNFCTSDRWMIQMDYKKYMLYNVIGAFIWVGSLAGIGYYFGSDPWVKKQHWLHNYRTDNHNSSFTFCKKLRRPRIAKKHLGIHSSGG